MAGCCAVLSLCGTVAAGELTIGHDAGGITLVAEDARLQQVLERLAGLEQLQVTTAAPLDSNVNLRLERVTLHLLLRRLLRHHSYTLDTARRRLHVHATGRNAPAVAFGPGAADDVTLALQRVAAPDPRERLDAAAVLGMSAGRTVVPALATVVNDADARVREEAVSALADSGDPTAAALLAQAASDPAPAVRIEVAHALAARIEAGHADAWPLLRRLRADPDDEVRREAADLLADLD